MLFFLDQPRTLLAIAVALLIGVVAHGVVQTLVASALGDRVPRSLGRASPDPRRHFDAFGTVVMIIAVVGWGRPVPLTEPRFGGRGRYVAAVLSGAATNLVIAYLALAGYAIAGGDRTVLGLGLADSFGAELLFTIAVVNTLLAALSLIPLPPLDGARVLWILAPRTEGWRKARYYLEEQNYGLGIVFLLMLPIFGNSEGLLRRIVDAIGRPLLRLMATSLGIDT